MDTLKEDKASYASARHREVLLGLLAHPEIERSFFLTGGTALSVFYLQHRLSDGLDLFTLEPVSLSELDPWVRARWKGSCSKIKEGPDFLSFLIDETKVEFVRDPLSNGDERPRAEFENGRRLKVDNLRNIVSNKLGAMVSRQEPKDFADFYFIAELDPGLDRERVWRDARRKDAIFDDPPTAAFQLEEGLALIREKPDLLPVIRKAFDRKAFFDYFSGLAEWIYRKYPR
ncbi:MAG TPA: nucleotidyl transferase AbiEii/AbiGii toxin family protein [Candidatus Aminicenantes bacterium]|nr:nucleotidyl transferase AbiEii/AbiGii toxin family protein [Candidatus Aminicenantes bacterium]